MTQHLSDLEHTQARIRSVKWRQIVLPFALGLLGVLLLTVLAGLAPRTSLTANMLLMAMILCPMFVILLVFIIVLTAAAYGMHRLNEMTESPMRRLEAFSLRARETTRSAADTVTKQTVDLSARAAPLEHWMNSAFEPKSRPMENRNGEE